MEYGYGHNFWYMWDMVQRGYVNDCTDSWVKQNFGPGLMLAICWRKPNSKTDAKPIARTICG